MGLISVEQSDASGRTLSENEGCTTFLAGVESNAMRVGIDLTALWRPTTGMETVAIEMTRALLRQDRNNEYVLFFSGEVHASLADAEGSFTKVVLPMRNEVISKNFYLPFMSSVRALDFLHFPVFPPPWWCPCPHGWTVPDATPWLYPQTMNAKSRLYFKTLGNRAFRNCRLLITDTQASRSDLLGFFGQRADQVRVICPGIRTIFRPLRDPAAFTRVRKKYSLSPEFLLCVATLEPRKNILGLIQSFAMLKAEGGFSPSLVIAGRKGWLYDRMLSEVSSSGVRDAITFTGYVPDEDLLALYNMARVFIYPSFYEGFGLPCIEAMACGCPVVTSNRGALLEVTGDAALHAEPESIIHLASTIRKACKDESLREQLILRGLERARLFSWELYAKEMLGAMGEAVRGE